MEEKTLFTRIIEGEIPAYRILEDEDFLAFLDINPVQAGHTLIVPKQAEDYLFDLTPTLLSRMLPFAQRVAHGIREAITCRKVAVAVIGLEVNHAHMHLVPITQEGDMDFKQKKTLSPEQMEQIAEEIRRHLPN